AFKLDPESTTELLLAGEFVPPHGARWLFAQHPPGRTLPLLEKLQQRNLLGPTFGGTEALWDARVAVDPHHWWPLAVQTAHTTGEIGLPDVLDWPADLIGSMVD